VFSKPQQLETDAQVYDAAIRILIRHTDPIHE